MPQAELVKELQNNWRGDQTPGVNAIRHMLADMEGEAVARVKEGYRYLSTPLCPDRVFTGCP